MTSDELKMQRPWFEAYPPPKNLQSKTVTRDILRQWILEGQKSGKNFVVVDVRREDHEGGTIKGAINLPAQSVYPSIPSLYTLFKAAGVKKVIWTCTTSRKRGNRVAGWFDDFVREKGDSDIESYALFEGLLGWATAGKDFTELMEEYNEETWHIAHSNH
ncbi:Rhodanese/Cell cycle control phosphatase [Pochonia chlamydosporia 170]|uniref:Rhodanese/Cell cycle control phosphatase n=1 Tax=Pochonia chlamydosporia 170 TaxID=1380566 RepID=A0A219ANW3_METCM|nr:Rhodanese/Cell cycle control phosphatase [Pochonia chlamydosporia 170]OWT42516.1 Rhodanese/Cell cycle control phosphatase [Pochonia chlamydosporia 170]